MERPRGGTYIIEILFRILGVILLVWCLYSFFPFWMNKLEFSNFIMNVLVVNLVGIVMRVPHQTTPILPGMVWGVGGGTAISILLKNANHVPFWLISLQILVAALGAYVGWLILVKCYPRNQ